MYDHRRSPTHFYYTAPYAVPVYGNVPYPVETAVDVNWYTSWPKSMSLFLALVIIICSAGIIGLDIANIAIEANKQDGASKLGSDTGKVGVGIWTGSISFFAAFFILGTGNKCRSQTHILLCYLMFSVFLRNKRITATFALVAVTLAFLFLIVLIGLIGNAIQNNLYANDRTDADKIQNRLLIAILAIACALMLFSIVFFILYIRVYFSSTIRPSVSR